MQGWGPNMLTQRDIDALPEVLNAVASDVQHNDEEVLSTVEWLTVAERDAIVATLPPLPLETVEQVASVQWYVDDRIGPAPLGFEFTVEDRVRRVVDQLVVLAYTSLPDAAERYPCGPYGR